MLNLRQATYSEAEAAKVLGLHPQTLRRRRLAGKISHLKDGRWVRYTRQHLEDYAATRAVDVTPPKVNDVRVGRDAIRRHAQ